MFLMKNGYPSPNPYQRIDWKMVLILILSIIVFILGGIWYFQGSHNKDEIKRLHDENKVLIDDRKQLKKELDVLKKINVVLVDDKQSIIDKLEETEITLQKYIKDAKHSASDVAKAKSELDKVIKQIDYLKKYPTNKTDDELIISLRKKFSKK